MGRIAASLLCISTLFLAVQAGIAETQAREKLGYGRLVVNDLIGDGRDRWRTGHYTSSRVWGRGWDGALPEDFGNILEFRLKAEVIAPENLEAPAAGDRPFAGSLSFGAHTHAQRAGYDVSLGGNLVLVGPMTGLAAFQTELHDLLGVSTLSDSARDAQIENSVRLEGVFEAGRDIALGQRATLRPFVEARAGVETMARAGFDLTLGTLGKGELLVRDSVTGTRYRTIKNPSKGTSVVLGADAAKVFDSVYLPSSQGYSLTDMRTRVRLGMHWQGEKSAVYYGVTWLSKEFEAQPEGQLVGAVRLNLDF